MFIQFAANINDIAFLHLSAPQRLVLICHVAVNPTGELAIP